MENESHYEKLVKKISDDYMDKKMLVLPRLTMGNDTGVEKKDRKGESMGLITIIYEYCEHGLTMGVLMESRKRKKRVRIWRLFVEKRKILNIIKDYKYPKTIYGTLKGPLTPNRPYIEF